MSLHRLRVSLVLLVILLLLTAGVAGAQGLVAVAANDYSTPEEHDNMVATLQDMGYTTVDVTSTAEASAAGACTLIVYAAGVYVPGQDLQAWVDSGNGLIQIGDWHDYFPNQWQGQLPTPTSVQVTLNAPAHPIAQGLEATWSGRGFFYYAWPDGAMGNTLGNLGEADIASVSAPGFDTRSYGIAAYDPEPGGRAVYLGINVYGPAAGPNELRLFQNSLAWLGCAAAAPIPTTSGRGIALTILLLAGAAFLVILRQRLA